MRKFIIAVIGLVLLLGGGWYCVYYQGFYVNWHKEEPLKVPVVAKDKQIMLADQEGEYRPFQVKGVSLNSSMPGFYFSDYAASEDIYLDWLQQISELGANTVWITTIMDDDFYNAFYAFNQDKDEPLYLLQGISVSDYGNRSSQDAYSRDFYGCLMRDAKDVVDVVHGRKDIALGRLRGSGHYREDISPWVLGYTVGFEWDTGIIAYTNHQGDHSSHYQGRYLNTQEGSCPFEALLAQVMDTLVAYETDKYRTQHPISFVNDPQNDPFAYEALFANQLSKYNCLDSENIVATQGLKAGYFASYRLYDFCTDFAQYFTKTQKEELGNILTDLNTDLYYDGYTELINEYHTMPVLISGYGFSSARGMISETEDGAGPLSEAGQGEALVSTYQDIITSGCVGAVVSSWQDNWGQRTWNTSYATDLADSIFWHDLQTDGQYYGLLSFDPGPEQRVCYVDGNFEEWNQDGMLVKSQGYELSLRYDAETIYLLIKGPEVTEEAPIYVPIDVTPLSGSKACLEPALSFERDADFLICLNGAGNSKLLVQSRYEAVRENYLMELEGRDPFARYPDVDDPNFQPINMVVLGLDRILDEEEMADRQRGQTTYSLWQTGDLFSGNGNPESPDYDSRTDLCYGPNCVEVRLPWALLNFSDPSENQVHDDYYKNFGVKNLNIDSLWFGVGSGDSSKTISMTNWEYDGWNSVEYHQRQKESYRILQQEWR